MTDQRESANMGGLRSRRFWWTECAVCRTRCYRDTDMPLFTSPAAAQSVFDPGGWGFTRRADGRVLCCECGDKADCAERGFHTYTPWEADPRDSEIEFRACEHCDGGFEDRLAALGGP